MLRSIQIALAVIGVLLGTASADADTFFSQQFSIGASGGTVNNAFKYNGNGGFSYNNVLGPLQSGATVISVGVIPLTNANLTNFTSPTPNYGAGNVAVAVYAIQGTVTNPSLTSLTATFSQGGAAIYVISEAQFSGIDPSTWVNGTKVGDWDLTSPANATQGAGAPVAFASTDVNKLSVNAQNPTLNQGVVLFDEVLTPGLFNITTSSPFGAGAVDPPNQLLVTLSETVLLPQNMPFPFLSNLNAANLLAQSFGLATFTGGPGDYTPLDPLGSGDVTTSLAVELIPGVQFATQEVPEPASMLIWGALGVAGIGYRRLAARRKILDA